MPAKSDLNKLGVAQAALLSSMLGVLTLAVVHLGTEMSDAFKDMVHGIGKLWMPGAQGIGPYSGKESLSLLAWLVSWGVLYLLLRRREIGAQLAVGIFLIGVAVATTLLWPPVFTALARH